MKVPQHVDRARLAQLEQWVQALKISMLSAICDMARAQWYLFELAGPRARRRARLAGAHRGRFSRPPTFVPWSQTGSPSRSWSRTTPGSTATPSSS